MYPSRNQDSATGKTRDIWPWDTDELLQTEGHQNEVTGKSRQTSTTRRKVIKLDHDRYHEADVKQQKSRKSDRGYGTDSRGITRKPYQTNGDLDLIIQDRKEEHRKVIDTHRQKLREANTEGSYLDNVPPSQTFSQNSIGDLTDSRALRETEIRFLNVQAPVQRENVKKNREPKLTYVDVPFPGQHSNNVPSNHHGNKDIPVTMDTGSAESSDQNNRTRRKKRGLIADLPENNDILIKLKERLRQQQLNASSSDTSSRDDSLLEQGPRQPQHVLHDPYDPVSMRPGANCDGSDKPTMTRKIAAGPPVPSYKGFTDIGTTSDSKQSSRPVSQSTPVLVKKKIKKPPPSVTIQPRKYEMYGTEYPSSGESGMSSTEKPKKPTRVVSTERKNPNEIITTSSWRAGQELVRQKLGPLRTKKTSGDSQRKDVVQPEEQRRPDGAEGHDLWQHVGSNNTGTMGKDRTKPKGTVAEETQKILDDLNIDRETSDEDGKHSTKPDRSRPAVKRKAPKQTEPDKQTSAAAKQRHYDQEAVRKYIAKQKADRQRKKKEEEENQMNESEKKKRHLEELYNKQKSSTQKSQKVTKTRPKSQKTRRTASDETHDRKRIVSCGSDKENNDTGHDLEDDSDTLTGNSEEETTPIGTPRDEKKKSRESEKAEQTTSLKPGLDPKLHINLDNAFARFSEVMKKREQAGLLIHPAQNLSNREGSDQDVESRKQAIKDMASCLRNRLRGITAPGTSGATANGPQTINTDTSSGSRATLQVPGPVGNQENKEYTSRYDRLVGRNSDVFTTISNLPGTRELGKRAREVLEENYQKEAAIRIQSAYRGHSARRSLDLSSQSAHHPEVEGATNKHKSKTHHHSADHEDESDISSSSTFSEVTRTDPIDDDSLNILPHRATMSQDKRQPPVGGACYVPPSKYKWEEPKADPYSVMNVLNRKSKLGKDAYSLTPLEKQIRDTVNQTVLPTDSRVSSRLSSHHYTSSLPVAVNNETNLRPSRSSSRGQSDDDSVRSSVSKSMSLRSSTKEPIKDNNMKSYQESTGKYSSFRDSDATDTDDSYSNLVPEKVRSDEWIPLRQDSEISLDREKTSRQDRPKQQRSEEWLPLRQDSELSVASDKSASLQDKRAQPTTSTNYQNINRAETGRYSPNSLDRQMMAELNRLESLEESYCQLAGVERTRAVSLAQQESVSLAQVLKSRQMAQDLEMKRLQLQAQQEAQASNQQLNDIRLRTQGNTHRSPYHSGFTVEPTLHSTPASKTNETYKKRSDVPASQSVSETTGRRSARERTENDVSDSVSARKTRDLSKISSSGSYSSRPKHSRSATTSSVITAKDSRLDSDSSSIKSVSDADGQDLSKTESIHEDIPDDYTLSFDDSITEDESFRQVLPSESHRKELKRKQSDDSFMQDDPGTSQLSLGDVSMSSLFVGGDTLGKFTADMVRQMMKEEELRAQHQAAMLRIRETALKKKAEAELSWLRQQKRHLRDKGADDVHPQIKKKEKTVLRELHEKQDEIRRLQEANLQTSRERQNVLKQQEAFAKAHQKKRMTKLQEGLKKLTGRLGRPSDIHTEDDASVLDETSDINEDISAKEYKSDSEIYGDKANNKVSKSDKRKLEKKQQLWLNDKYLTKREIKLLNRKKNAEELLAWKKHLDDQEAEVFEMEKKALDAWKNESKDDRKKGKKSEKGADKKTEKKLTEKKAEKVEPVEESKVSKSKPPARTESESVISEQISTAKDDSYSTSHMTTHDTRQKTDQTEVKTQPRSPKGSASDQSIPEEVPSRTSSSATPDNKHKINDSSDDTIVNSSVNEEYTNDTFEETTASRSQRKPLSRYLPSGSPLPSPWSRRTGSESESEDSISHTDTVSDTSDYEGRIRHLNDELRRRRKECDLLKKARKARKKEKLKAQEESLKKQVEAYDNYINQLKHEQSDLELEPNKSVVKPLIKHPKSKVRQEEVTPTRQRDTEGSFSSSYEDTINGSDSAQNSPNLSDSRETSKMSPLVDKKSFLDRISEGSESEKSAPKLAQKTDVKEAQSQSSVSEVIEELSEGSDVTKTESGILKLDIEKGAKPLDDEIDHTKADDDASYSLDFTASASSLHTNLKPSLSARSDKSVSRILSPRDDSRISEVIDEAISVQSDASKSVKPDDTKPKEVEKSEVSAAEKSISQALTGIQESDSETDSHAKSHHTLSYSPTVSRPSSGTERSVASSYGVNFEDEESERTVESESESEKTPVRLPAQGHSQASKVARQVSEEDISDHISASLPSLSEKKPASLRDDLNKDLDDLLGEISEDELTPREATPLIGDDENSALLLTDPLAEFQINEPVLVWGRKKGKLMYKGKVDFAPGVWAGVELEKPDEDQDDVCQKYFDCRQGHGVLVAGSDISTVPEDMKFDTKPTADDSLTSQEEGSATDSDLEKVIKDAAQNVQEFRSKPEPRDVEALADKLTNEIAAEIIVDSVETMEGISNKQAKKVPPPTLPKPKKKTTEADVSPQKEAPESPKSEKAADEVMNKLLENAITQMIDIRNKKRENNQLVNGETPLVNGHLGSSSDQSDLEEMLQHDDGQRPGTPNLAISRTKEVQQLDKDLLDLLGGEDDGDDDYFEETLGVANNKTQQAGIIQAQREEEKEIVYAVPHEKSEVEAIVNDSIDIYWNCRRCGEPFTDVTPPDSFFKTDQSNLSMEQTSEKTYKKMLFNLTGEIICDIYSQEEEVVLQPYEKPKRRRQQYFKGYAPPTTVDNLRPIVHKAINDILGVNGTRKADRVKNKFNIRKKKDNVDNILTLQLREEEPDWIDYNADELDVKNALADSIFEVLLAETVETCSKIHEKKLKRVS